MSKANSLVDQKIIKWDWSIASLLHASWDSTLRTDEGIKSLRVLKKKVKNPHSQMYSFPMKAGPDLLWATYSRNQNPSHIVLQVEKPARFQLTLPSITKSNTTVSDMLIEGSSKFRRELSAAKRVRERSRFLVKRRSDPIGVPIEREYGDEWGCVNQDL